MVTTSGAAGLRRRVARQWRWSVVITGIVLLALVPSIVAAWPVQDPDVTTAELVRRIGASGDVAYEGLYESRGGVRLPDLGRYDDQVQIFTETTRVRVWFAAADRWRSDVVTTAGEVGWYREPGGLWRWQTGRQQVVFASRPADGDEPTRFARPMDLSPPELGRRVVALGEEGAVTISRIEPRRIAGQTTAGVRLTPTVPASTTISSIEVWADPDTGVPMRVEVFAGGRVPTLETAFLDWAAATPAAGVLRFDPEETGVRYRRSSTMDALESLDSFGLPMPETVGGLPRRGGAHLGVQTYGTGTSIVVAVAAPRGVLGRRLAALPSSARPWGGEAVVVEAGLVNVEIVDGSGVSYVLAGTVPVGVLDAMAADLVGAAAEADG